ncbi:hypothetical protein FHL15_011191 [Xylaria flabelliformis]|uniref:Uncharacterized protein n=1 Tax=Xylaria flabelliformis TaxID=2512241 RepID=A0A553HIW9_9PEZI|nr:hypothetical protein FHL15_011191 [Xylaria flabelliformis]
MCQGVAENDRVELVVSYPLGVAWDVRDTGAVQVFGILNPVFPEMKTKDKCSSRVGSRGYQGTNIFGSCLAFSHVQAIQREVSACLLQRVTAEVTDDEIIRPPMATEILIHSLHDLVPSKCDLTFTYTRTPS